MGLRWDSHAPLRVEPHRAEEENSHRVNNG